MSISRELANQAKNPQLHRLYFRSMGCRMSLWSVASDRTLAEARLHAGNIYFNVAERELSRFRPDSGLRRLNSGAGRPVKVSPMLWQMLSASLDAARATNGLYDPTILNALVLAGYSSSFETVGRHKSPGPPSPEFQSSWEDIHLNQDGLTVTLPPGTSIDLGGISKGWVAQHVAQFLSALGPCLVDAGGDIAAIGHPPKMAGWPVGVADPFSEDSNLAVLSVKDQGVATSGTDYRHWDAGGSRQHHIIDPRTGRPAQTDLLTVTVIARDAVQAELHAKMALILGAQPGWKYLTELASVEGILVFPDGSNAITPNLSNHLLKDTWKCWGSA